MLVEISDPFGFFAHFSGKLVVKVLGDIPVTVGLPSKEILLNVYRKISKLIYL
jgi:hypothetical protein